MKSRFDLLKTDTFWKETIENLLYYKNFNGRDRRKKFIDTLVAYKNELLNERPDIDIDTVLSNLCYHDKRNPYHYGDDCVRANPCNCDNCFHHRTELAESLIKFYKIEDEN